ncbi:F-box/LRR-repeat protein At5g02910-like [Trifolium pratense]|uniref:F-box/LRR-repeat protein At5g02910-like n=1 Tax=Trifolium pratense TaxID=57577 RepID=UPI001E69693D|nr:F-box/LRR-repeat protein At5g02910-like [Trifolium pratense]
MHKHNREKNEDRLGDLPDDVLHHILSFSDAKQAVQYCILSKRWKNLWKTLPTLKLTSTQFTTRRAFTEFVYNILCHRDASTSLYTFDFYGDGRIETQLLERILKYVFSHNGQRLKINTNYDDLRFPPSYFSCHTLTSLDLSLNPYCKGSLFLNSLNLPALANLSLQGFIFCDKDDSRINPFSTLNRLNSLNIAHCICSGKQCLFISSATLANLTIKDWPNKQKFQLSAPSLCTFDFSGILHEKLYGSFSNLSSVKNVNINAYCYKTRLVLLNWLIQLPNTESLIVSVDALKVLSFVPDILKVEFPSLYSLKSLKVTTYYDSSLIPTEIVNFLLQNAPSAKVDYTLFLLGCPILEDLQLDLGIKHRDMTMKNMGVLPNLVEVRITDNWNSLTPMVLVCKAKILHVEDMLLWQWTELPMFHNLINLEVSLSTMAFFGECKSLIGILAHFPKLQHFIIQDSRGVLSECFDCWNDPPIVAECLSLQLKTFSINGYGGSEYEFGLIFCCFFNNWMWGMTNIFSFLFAVNFEHYYDPYFKLLQLLI